MSSDSPSRKRALRQVCHWQAALQHPRALRKHAPLVARDALAVLTGLRPAAMLDYAVLDAATLRAVGAALRAAAPHAGSCSLRSSRQTLIWVD